MISLLTAFVLYHFNADPVWWAAFIIILVLRSVFGLAEFSKSQKSEK